VAEHPVNKKTEAIAVLANTEVLIIKIPSSLHLKISSLLGGIGRSEKEL